MTSTSVYVASQKDEKHSEGASFRSCQHIVGHSVFAFLSHNLDPNSQSGEKHPDIELSILELSKKSYYKIYTVSHTHHSL